MNTIITYVHDKRQNINRYFNQKVRQRMSEEGAADNYYYYYYYYYLLLLNTTTDNFHRFCPPYAMGLQDTNRRSRKMHSTENF